MMLDWNEYQKQLNGRSAEIVKLSTETLRVTRCFPSANAKTTHVGGKVRQLICLAAAVTLRCEGCIVFHTDAALKAGANKEEINEALGVAVAMNAGASMVYSARVMDAVEAKTSAATA